MVLAIIILFFLAGVIFTLYPILPGALFVTVGIVIYGWVGGWHAFPGWFWVIQLLLVTLNFSTDWTANLLGIKRAGGSKQAIWGSAIGVIVGPLLFGPVGILIGPVLGAMAGELLHIREVRHITRVGVASFVGFLVGTLIKLTFVLGQVLLFFLQIW